VQAALAAAHATATTCAPSQPCLVRHFFIFRSQQSPFKLATHGALTSLPCPAQTKIVAHNLAGDMSRLEKDYDIKFPMSPNPNLVNTMRLAKEVSLIVAHTVCRRTCIWRRAGLECVRHAPSAFLAIPYLPLQSEPHLYVIRGSIVPPKIAFVHRFCQPVYLCTFTLSHLRLITLSTQVVIVLLLVILTLFPITAAFGSASLLFAALSRYTKLLRHSINKMNGWCMIITFCTQANPRPDLRVNQVNRQRSERETVIYI